METILASVQGVIGTVLTGVVALVGKYIIAYLSEKTSGIKEEKLKILLETNLHRADKLTDTIVKQLEQTTVKSLKEKSEDGKLTKHDVSEIKRETDAMLKTFVDINLKEALDYAMGDSEKYLKSLIEAKVYELSLATEAASPVITSDDYIPNPEELEATIQ